MANDLTGSVMKIDSAGSITSESTVIKYIRWVAPAAVAGNKVVIQDAGSRVIWESVAPGGNYVESDYPNVQIKGGFSVTTIDSGTLYIINS